MKLGILLRCCLLAVSLVTVVQTSDLVAQSQKKIAFLVGVNDYFKKDLRDLQFAENDVTAVAAELKRLGFETTVLTGRGATREKIQTGLANFIDRASKLESDDIVFAMFSGHGQELQSVIEKRVPANDQMTVVKRVETIPYFCARDAIPYDRDSHLLRGKSEQEITEEFKLISINRLIGDLNRKSNSLRNVLVVDACRNDPAKGGGKSANISGGMVRDLPEGLSILFSARSGQQSWESSDTKIKHGVMSHFLLEGLRGGAADENEITWSDLTSYVLKRVERNAGKLAGDPQRIQIPHAISNSTGLLVLGKVDVKRKAVPKLKPTPKPKPKSVASPTLRSISNRIGMNFRLIPAGTFIMGSPISETGRSKDEPQHEVQLVDSYWMATHEVSQEQWYSVMKTRPWSGASPNESDAAASKISWEDANEFCTALSIKEGYAYRLPTEAEWERACRAGTQSAFSFGNQGTQLAQYGWSPVNAGDNAEPVGQKLPNQYGLYDMHGNVWEWCSDWYGENYYLQSPKRDPVGPETGTTKVLRSGCFL